MDIAVYAEDLRVYSSGTSSRNMLRELMALRAGDRFHMVVRQPTDREPWWRDYLAQLAGDRWSVAVEPRTRRTVNLLSLAGLRNANAVRARADVFIRFGPGILGARDRPLIGLVADLSSLRTPAACSLPWHGRRLAQRQIPWMAHVARAIVATSDFTRRDLLDWDSTLEERVTVVHNGIGDSWLRVAAAPPAAPAAEPGYWVWYGQITPRKNIPRLLEAYACLLRLPAFRAVLPRLCLVAAPPDAIVTQARQLGLADRVTFQAPLPVPDLVDLVAGSRGLLFPSLYEGFGMPVVEAMACGVPVLTSDRTAMPEVAGGLAVLCDPENVGSIADGMRALLSPAQVDPGAIAARKTWAGRFTARRAACVYSALIDQVVEESDRVQP